jgi:glycosyltransferase involved in cell wall biosynthesis
MQNSRPRILALSSRLPYPLVGGDRLRVYHLLRLLSERYQIDLLTFLHRPPAGDVLDHLGSFLGRVVWFSHGTARSILHAGSYFVAKRFPLQVGYYYFGDIQNWVLRNYTDYDLLLCFHVRMAEYLHGLACKKVVDLVDAISLNYSRALAQGHGGAWGSVYKLESTRLLEYEKRVVEEFDSTFITSHVDQRYLVENGASEGRIQVLPLATHIPELPYSETASPDIDIIFHGNMQTQPNQQAVMFFVQRVLTLIRRKGWDPVFYVVGMNPSKEILRLANGKKVVVTGHVPDVAAYLHRAKLLVAPMTFGAGVQTKVLEAMAHNKPVVTTSVGAEGIEGESGVHYLVADTPDDFASSVVQLLVDPSLRTRIGSAARDLVERRYTWNVVKGLLYKEIDSVLGK